MTVHAWPAAFVPATLSFRLRPNTQSFTSPLSGATQTAELPGARWMAELAMPAFTRAQWRAWNALMARLRGQSGRIYYGPQHYSGPTRDWDVAPAAWCADSTMLTVDSAAVSVNQVGVDTSAPVVAGADQTGAILLTSGWLPDADVLAAGDYFSYPVGADGRQLHIVVADARSDAAGAAAIEIEPPIRTAPADGAAIEIRAPVCVMGLADDDQGGMTYEPALIGRAGCTLVERF